MGNIKNYITIVNRTKNWKPGVILFVIIKPIKPIPYGLNLMFMPILKFE